MTISTTPIYETRISPEDKKRLLDRLARVEGQIRGVRKMIGENKDCEQIAQQISAARGALDKAFSDQISCAISRRLADSGIDTTESRLAVKEILQLMTRYG